MALQLFPSAISSFCGDVLPLRVDSSDTSAVSVDSADPSIARIKQLCPLHYLVVLEQPGETILTVQSAAGITQCPVTVREALVSDPDGSFQIYCSDTHSHTSYSDGQLTPFVAFRQVREEGYFDCFTISDHCANVDDLEFFHTFEAAAQNQTDDFVAFAACESEVHPQTLNSIGRKQNNGGEIVTIQTEGRCTTDSWDVFFDSVGTNRLGFGIMAHPQILGYSIHSIWNAFDPEHTTHPRVRDFIRGVETINETDDSNLINERVFSLLLDCGYKVAPLAASDHHGVQWGKNAIRSKTFLYSQGKSKELFLDAYRNARAYSCENGNVKLFYTVNGHNPASTLPLAQTYTFHITAELFHPALEEDRCVLLEILSDYGQVLTSKELDGLSQDITVTLTSSTARYFYLRLYSEAGDRTWSCPVWTGRSFDPLPTPLPLQEAQNDETFRIACCSGGTHPESVLNTDLSDYYLSDTSDAELIIDMGRVRTISAVGYYPNSTVRDKPETIARFLSRYEYLTSTDGSHYQSVSNGTVRLYGSEHVSRFPETEARYLKVKALSSVGSESRKKAFINSPVAIGALRIY